MSWAKFQRKYFVIGKEVFFFKSSQEVGLYQIEKAFGIGHDVALIVLPADLKAFPRPEQILDFVPILSMHGYLDSWEFTVWVRRDFKSSASIVAIIILTIIQI